MTKYNINTDEFAGLLHALYCSECKMKTKIEYEFIAKNNNMTFFAIAHCVDCKKLTFFQYIRTPNTFSNIFSSTKIYVKSNHIFPLSSETKTEDVPEKIAKSYLEGIRCLDSNAPNGAVSMFRKSLEQICVDRCPDISGTLVKRIQGLPKDTIPTADEIREWGNFGVHEDRSGRVVDVTPDQANSIKQFLTRIFLNIYQHPAELKRLKDQRS